MGLFRRRRLVFQVLLTAVLLLLLVWRVDVAQAIRHLRETQLGWVALGSAIFLLSKLIQVVRWRLALWRHPGLPLRRLVGIFFVSTLANALVPLRGGDLLRMQLASQRLGLSRAEVAATIFAVETPLNWVTLAGLLAGVLLFVDLSPGATAFATVTALLFALAFTGSVLLARVDRSRDLAGVWPVRLLPDRTRRALGDLGSRFLVGMALLRNLRLAACAVALCFLIWLVEVGVYWCLARAFRLELSFAGALVVMVAANLVFSTPLTPGSIGAYQVAVSELAIQVGVDPAAAGSFAIGSHLLLIICIAVTGIPATWALGLSVQDLIGARPGRSQPEAVPPGGGEQRG